MPADPGTGEESGDDPDELLDISPEAEYNKKVKMRIGARASGRRCPRGVIPRGSADLPNYRKEISQC